MFLLSKDSYYVQKTKNKGQGVFAKKEIPAGTIIGDYLGLLIKDEEIEALEKKHGDASYAMDYSNNGLSIFPLDIKADGIHLINHSCAANCEAYFYHGHTLYFTLRRLYPREELTIDYGFDPYEIINFGKKEKRNANVEAPRSLTPYCHCGSDFCRGTMYANEKKIKEYGDFYHQEAAKQKYKLQKNTEILLRLKEYPKEIKDHKIFNLFANEKMRPLLRTDKKMPALSKLRSLLRASGRTIHFKNIGLKVVAVIDERVVIKK